MTHILLKGTQVGAVLGLAALVPITAYQTLYKGVAVTALTPTIMKTSSRFLLGGFAATGMLFLCTHHTPPLHTDTAVLGAARVSTLDADGVFDRAYRLKYNQGQTRTDVFANCAGAVGAGAAAAALGVNFTNVGGGAGLGIALGVMLHVLTSSNATKHNSMVDEAKTLLDRA